MKNLMTVLILAASALSTSAFATSHKEAPDMAGAASAPSAPMGHQQSKMGDCNKQAADKTGAERKAFMKTCLKAAPTSAASGAMAASTAVVAASGSPQQSKMKACNADPVAKSTKGAERRAFMKECLSK